MTESERRCIEAVRRIIVGERTKPVIVPWELAEQLVMAAGLSRLDATCVLNDAIAAGLIGAEGQPIIGVSRLVFRPHASTLGGSSTG